LRAVLVLRCTEAGHRTVNLRESSQAGHCGGILFRGRRGKSCAGY
jgi:hypothetical protein